MLHTAKHLGDRREQTATKLNKAQVSVGKSLRDRTFAITQKTDNV